MELILVRHGETAWSRSGQHTGMTDLRLTSNGHRQAVSLRPLLDSVLDGLRPIVCSSPRQRALQTATLAFPAIRPVIEPLLAEFDYGTYEGLTTDEIAVRSPGWNIWDDGCPRGESTDQVGLRADRFLDRYVNGSVEPVVVFSHGHFSRILAARALGQSAATGRLFASATASVSVISNHDGERCTPLWNVSADFVDDVLARARHAGELPTVGEQHEVREPRERSEELPPAASDTTWRH